MDLKFSFGGASPDHSHGDAPSGIPLPFSTSPSSTSSVLGVQVRLDANELVAEAISGDGVTYGRAVVPVQDQTPAALARKTQSGISRVVAELDGPLAESITDITLSLGEHTDAIVTELGFSGEELSTSEAFQRRTGVAAGTPVRVG